MKDKNYIRGITIIIIILLVAIFVFGLLFALSKKNKNTDEPNTDVWTYQDLSKYNIAYGEEAPKDTTKLWVKSDKPKKIEVSDTIRKTVTKEKIETLDWELSIDNSVSAGALIGTDLYLCANGISKIDLLTGECTQESTEGVASGAIAVPYGQYIYFAYMTSSYSTGEYTCRTYVKKFNTVNNQFIGSWNSNTSWVSGKAPSTEISGFIYNDMFYICCQNFSGAFDLEKCKFDSSVSYPISGLRPSEFLNSYLYCFRSNAVDQVDLTGNEDKKQFDFPYTSNFYFTPKGIGNNMYLFGQAGSLGGNSIQRFNTTSGNLDVLDLIMSVSRKKPIVAQLGAEFYILGGCSASGNTIVEKFMTEFELEQGTLILLTNGKKKNEIALWKDEEGVDYMTSISSAYIGNDKGKGESVDVYLYDNDLFDWRLIAA